MRIAVGQGGGECSWRGNSTQGIERSVWLKYKLQEEGDEAGEFIHVQCREPYKAFEGV